MVLYQLTTAVGDPINGQTYLDKDVALFNRSKIENEKKREIILKKVFVSKKTAFKIINDSNGYFNFISCFRK